MDVEVERAAEALDQGDRTGLGRGTWRPVTPQAPRDFPLLLPELGLLRCAMGTAGARAGVHDAAPPVTSFQHDVLGTAPQVSSARSTGG